MKTLRTHGLGYAVAMAIAYGTWAPALAREVTFEQRVEAQRAIEQVYWSHRIWPEVNRDPKPPLEELLPEEALLAKVEDGLVKSAMLGSYWRRPLRGEDLQAEIDRMVRDTKSPTVLRELFTALGDDPFLIAECLARPLLAERLVETRFLEAEKIREAKGLAEQTFEDWLRDGARGLSPDPAPLVSPESDYVVPVPLLGSCTHNTWSPTSLVSAPSPREEHTAVWTGSEMIVWGGHDGPAGYNSGGRYSPATDSWTATSTGANTPPAMSRHGAVWTGSTMIVWGATGGVGGRYSPAMNSWTPTSTVNAPAGRTSFSTVWTGSLMIVWGGSNAGGLQNTGGRYDPATDTWTPTTTIGAPSARFLHSAVWSGSLMIVWGGSPDSGANALNTGGRYDPFMDSWTPTSTTSGVPVPRIRHGAVWTGSEMIVMGGFYSQVLQGQASGGRYNPATNSWTSMTPRSNALDSVRAVWTGDYMIVWGPQTFNANLGGWYHPATNVWASTNLQGLPLKRVGDTAIWTGGADRRLIVWGGGDPNVDTDTGGLYCAGECPHGLACNDNNLCTAPDACTQGTCVGTPSVVCTPLDACHDAGTCDIQTGICPTGPPKPDGTACTDGNACTASCPTCAQDACYSGVCSCGPGSCTSTPSRSVTTVPSTDVPKTIAPASPNVVLSNLTVSISGNPSLDDVNVQTFLRHTGASNVDMTIRSPAGTIVTLTTDNGVFLDNVFNGTIWDDDANPGGQVPYGTNTGLATDHNYANNVVASPLAPEEPLGAFVGENPNGVWTLTISDDMNSDGGTLDNWSVTLATIDATVRSQASATYASAQVPQTIPATVSTITASIVVAGAGSWIGGVKVTTDITHTNSSDLDVTLQSPAGTVVTLTTDNGSTHNNIFHTTQWDDRANLLGQVPYSLNAGLATDHPYSDGTTATPLAPEEGLAAFRGENPNGTWTLTISDDTAPEGGALDAFSLEITTEVCAQSCAFDCSDADACTSDSCHTTLGCQHACAGGAECIPVEVPSIAFASNKTTLSWPHAAGSSKHDVVKGRVEEIPIWYDVGTTCIASNLSGTSLTAADLPLPGRAFWYDVRGHHLCGAGPWGGYSNGTTRAITACP